MNTGRKIWLGVTAVSILVILGFIIFNKIPIHLTPLDLAILGLAIGIGIVAVVKGIKRDQEEKEGYPLEDELSEFIKYKTGYYSFLTSIYIWILILVFRSKFPDSETAIEVGILLSVAFSFINKIFVEKQIHEKQD